MELPDTKQLKINYSLTRIAVKSRARPNLMKPIRQAAAKKHLYLFAPSGYGKTATTLDWLNDRQCAAAWIALSKKDNSPHTFFKRLIPAFVYIQPDNIILKEKLRGTITSESSALLAEKASCYLSEKAAKSYIILDDFWHITDEDLIRGLIKVIRALPESCGVVIIDRKEPHNLFSDIILRNQMSIIEKEKLIF